MTDIGHEGQWRLMSIRELERSNPYGIKIEHFAGDTMTPEIHGYGMDGDEHRALVDRVVAGRVPR